VRILFWPSSTANIELWINRCRYINTRRRRRTDLYFCVYLSSSPLSARSHLCLLRKEQRVPACPALFPSIMLSSLFSARGLLCSIFLVFSLLRVARGSPFVGRTRTVPDDDFDESIFDWDEDDAHFSTSLEPTNPTTQSGSGEGAEAQEAEETDGLSTSQSLRYHQIPFWADRPIHCPGLPPLPGAVAPLLSYPTGVRRESYGSLQELCWNNKNGRPPGLACYCANPGVSDLVSCLGNKWHVGDERFQRTSAISICEDTCRCPLVYGSAGGSEKTIVGLPGLQRGVSSSLSGLSRVSSLTRALSKQKSGSSSGGGGTCATRCHSNRYCSVGGRDHTCARCVIQETVDPISRARNGFQALCLGLGAASGGRKRSIEVGEEIPGFNEAILIEPACACNASYISKACCFEDGGGLVWEGPEMRLGDVALDL
jgi:hypothetical protein